MFKLDDNFLQEIGLGGLPAQDKNAMLQQIYETLEIRVGMRLAEQMSDAQLDEFEQFINKNDEAGALKWLETNLPHYKDVVAEELNKLKEEIKANAPQILQVAQQQAAAQPQTPPAAPQAGQTSTPPPAAPQQAPAAPEANPAPTPSQAPPSPPTPEVGPSPSAETPTSFDQDQQPPMAA